MARKVVIETGCIYLLDDTEHILDLIKEVGFKYYDFSLYWKGTTEHIGVGDDYLENAKKVKAYADKLGLKCEQTHTYFVNGTDEDTNRIRIEYIKKDLRTSALLGAKCAVIHPLTEYGMKENIEFFNNFIPLAKELGIKIAIENCFYPINGVIHPCITSTPAGLVSLIDALNTDCVGACLDLGHASLTQLGTSAVEMVKALGKRLLCLHIHDNDLYDDLHEVPYTNKVPFNAILKALKEYDYQGNITFEVERCYCNDGNPDISVPIELYPAFLRLEKEIGEYFVKYLDK